MLRGLGKLTWLEMKIFLREPLGAFGSIFFPVLIFVLAGRWFGGMRSPVAMEPNGLLRLKLPIFSALLITISAVMSLVTIIAVYREGGILRRLAVLVTGVLDKQLGAKRSSRGPAFARPYRQEHRTIERSCHCHRASTRQQP